jgi:predicted nucleic acid-binding protein
MDRSDQDHAACIQLLSTDEPLIVPAPVIVELAWLVSSRLGHVAFGAFLDDVETGIYLVMDLTRPDYARVNDLCSQYADLPLDFVDASVLAVVERLDERKVATLDHRHFRVVRPIHVRTLTLLPHRD